jgi:hypothetical protein
VGRAWKRWALALVALVALALLLGAFTLGAAQPWTANHFGYALAGRDGLPTYVFARGRGYQSAQACAGADWCAADRARLNIPRCWTQADLSSHHAWPLEPVATMFTLFGAPRTLLQPVGDSDVTAPIIIADGPDCYTMYGLEGGP